MISYFCHFGDTQVGTPLKQIIFNKGKLISYFSENLRASNYGNFLKKILIRIFIDGDIEQYPQITHKSNIFSKKDKWAAINFHLLKNEIDEMDEEKTIKFLIESTLYSIDSSEAIIEELGEEFNGSLMKKDILDLFTQKGLHIYHH